MTDTYKPYQDDEEDRLHEPRLKEIEAQLNEKFGFPESDDEPGELPYDAEADRKSWNELEKILTAFLKKVVSRGLVLKNCVDRLNENFYSR